MEIPTHRISGADEEMCCLLEECISYIGISGNVKATNFPTLLPNLCGNINFTNGAFRRTYSVNVWIKVKIFCDIAKC